MELLIDLIPMFYYVFLYTASLLKNFFTVLYGYSFYSLYLYFYRLTLVWCFVSRFNNCYLCWFIYFCINVILYI